jgi:flagellar biosynthetic protein FliR
MSSLYDAAVPYLTTFGLVLARVAALLFAAPVLSGELLPAQVRAVVTFALAATVALALGPVGPARMEPGALAVALLGEVAIGAAMGYVARLLLATAESAGNIIDVTAGFGFAQTVDPLSGQTAGVMGRILFLLVAFLFFVADGHHILIAGVAESFRTAAPGTFALKPGLLVLLRDVGPAVLSGALRLAAPIFLILVAVNVTLALVARAAPSLNVFAIGFLVTIGVALLAMPMLMSRYGALFLGLLERVRAAVLAVARAA